MIKEYVFFLAYAGKMTEQKLKYHISSDIRRFQGERVEFFLNRTSLTPFRFLMRFFWKIPTKAPPEKNNDYSH